MKKNILYLITLVLLFVASSCSNEFLEENKKQMDGYTLDAPLFVQPTNEFTEVSVVLPDLKNKDFKVLQYPKIIHFETFDGHIDETGKLFFRIKVDEFENPVKLEPQHLGNVILNVADFGLLSIPVQSVNWGIPKAEISETFIDFLKSNREKELIVSNKGTGYLFVKMNDLPSWLSITPKSYAEQHQNGFIIIRENSSVEYKLTVNRKGLSAGNYEHNLIIISNDIDQNDHVVPIKMTVRENQNANNIFPIGGIVVDAEFNDKINTLYVASSANKVFVFNTNTEKIEKILTFGQNINALSLSEKKDKLFVGQSGLVSIYNTENLNEISSIETDFMASDVIDGENDYYYIAKKDGNFQTYFYTYEISSKKFYPSGTYIDRIEGNSLLKVLNKPYILTTRIETSPNGLTLANIENGKPVWKKYWHQSFGDKLWQKEDGSIIIGRQGIVFKTPTPETSDPIGYLGILKPDNQVNNSNFGYTYNWINMNTQTKSIWGAFYDANDFYRLPPTVIEWDEATYTIRRTILFDDYYTEWNGEKDFYRTIPYYVFSTKEGNKIVLVKNIMNPQDSHNAHLINAWHLEIIDTTN